LHEKAGYKTAASTSLGITSKSAWQTGRCPYKAVWKRQICVITPDQGGQKRLELPLPPVRDFAS
jgi:hypothetical protein